MLDDFNNGFHYVTIILRKQVEITCIKDMLNTLSSEVNEEVSRSLLQRKEYTLDLSRP